MLKYYFILFSAFLAQKSFAQLLVARDTITVIENNYVLKMPWANGVNYSNVSNIDLNFDGKKDLVVFDKINQFSVGRFRCFINNGSAGQIKYIAAPDLSYSFPNTVNWGVCLDYNCDGKEDLLCSVNGGIKVYKNVSTPSLGINFVLEKAIVYSDFNPLGVPSIAPLYASTIGVPGFADIDGDGDIDILTFSSGGFYLEYHKNMSIEKGYGCDSLIYQLQDACWGKITEQSCSVSLNQCPLKPISDQFFPPNNKQPLHAGSCLMCFDSNGDNLLDLIMGDISCNTVQYASNTGSVTNAVISDTTKLYPNYPNKNSTTQIKMNNFPCTYYVDCDGDGKKDLVATPNAFGSENFNSLWYYKNASTTNTVNFQFVKKNFLQDEMIEVGQNSFPVLFDYDADGKKDLLIGTYGYYNTTSLKAQLALYRNTGTLAQPSFSLITRDYASISLQNLNNVMPTVGDIDNDGDIDICIGTSSGQIHWLENTAGSGNLCNFSLFHANSFSFTTNSAAAAPQLFDIDKDGKLDLMIGTKNGRIAYYKNTGSLTVPAYSLITNFFGGVDVKGDINLYGIDGYAAPHFFNEGPNTKLLVGNVTGTIFYYDVPAIITNTCNLIDADANNLNEGGQSTVFFEDINNDGKRDLFVGNGSGGLSFFSSLNQFVGINENTLSKAFDNITLYPNPTKNYLNLRVNELEFDSGKLIIYNILGKEIEVFEINSNSQSFLIKHISEGIYFAKITLTHNSQTKSIIKKIIIE
ncbi:MAG: FG-GAP-like repeat-containing protein [Bacteroidota bacterium]|nr:FG-GAP-like repeat-containing protein [Bacteroidota bacterium]MDP3147163.1 FG-GAP-like repeat-containing protein [Bacteroidota bacterium]